MTNKQRQASVDSEIEVINNQLSIFDLSET